MWVEQVWSWRKIQEFCFGHGKFVMRQDDQPGDPGVFFGSPDYELAGMAGCPSPVRKVRVSGAVSMTCLLSMKQKKQKE